MYAYIKGELIECDSSRCVVDVNGIGYELFINQQTFEKVQGQKNIKLLCYYHKHDNGDTLFGFYSKEDKSLFTRLISVNKIGPSTAQTMMGTFPTVELATSIVTANVAKLSSIKGIGKKTAERIILELKDKLKELGNAENSVSNNFGSSHIQEAEQALLSLGFHKNQITATFKLIHDSDQSLESTESYIKEALSILSN